VEKPVLVAAPWLSLGLIHQDKMMDTLNIIPNAHILFASAENTALTAQNTQVVSHLTHVVLCWDHHPLPQSAGNIIRVMASWACSKSSTLSGPLR
jgi:hypothetical protein